jgi:hypothetical protein
MDKSKKVHFVNYPWRYQKMCQTRKKVINMLISIVLAGLSDCRPTVLRSAGGPGLDNCYTPKLLPGYNLPK